MNQPLGVGIIGCGSISTSYMKLGPLFKGFEIRACADIDQDAAKARASEFDLRAETVDGLLAADDIDLVVNLTIPAAHLDVSSQVLSAGKHVYSEKPFVLSLADGQQLADLASRNGLRVGSAPDTYLGGAHQLARFLIDDGAIGKVTSGTCHVMNHGMEHWHPNPDFFYKPGGGPILDLGPYYITNLVQLLGPVKKVAALSSIPATVRTITSEPRNGDKLTVETPTTVHALLEFSNGATITLGASWDVWANGHHNMELYGQDGTLFLPDPNFFGGELRMTRGEEPVGEPPKWEHPLGVPNQEHPSGMMANYRGIGLADMATAIQQDRPHRCSLESALHVVDIMTSILESGETGRFVDLRSTCERPAALGVAEARSLLAEG